MYTIKSIAVYCGSRKGNNPAYEKAALQLSDYFIQHNIRLINGGGSIGLMGVMADRMLSQSGEAVGVIPLSLKDKEVAHLGMTELIVTPDMHSRKLTMVNLSDAFIAIPGGFGTLDELFETLTWSQLHLHRKPIGLLNVDGYFNSLIQMIDDFLAAGFISEQSKSLLYVHDEVEGLVQLLQNHAVSSSTKWEE